MIVTETSYSVACDKCGEVLSGENDSMCLEPIKKAIAIARERGWVISYCPWEIPSLEALQKHPALCTDCIRGKARDK